MSASTRIATRYAKSLLDLARERGNLDVVTDNMRHFQVSVKNADLLSLLKSPVVSTSKKLNVLDALFGDYNEMTSSFFRIVTSKRREEVLPDIANAYMEQYNLEQGISKLKITSATQLDSSAIEAIKAKLLAGGLITSKVEIELVIDPEILGGFVIEVGDKLFDSSVASQLSKLRKGFTGNSYQKNL
ncbi:MAG: ATP synthase F1 subunit delta [Saprospiraceae bacterium]